MLCSGSFPLGAHFYSAGKVFSVFAVHPGSLGAVWHLPYHALSKGRARGSCPCCEISKVQRYIPWTSSPTLWLICSFFTPVSCFWSLHEKPMKWLFIIFVEYLSGGAVSKVGQWVNFTWKIVILSLISIGEGFLLCSAKGTSSTSLTFIAFLKIRSTNPVVS